MQRTTVLVSLFVVVAVLQVAAPVHLIWRYEYTLRTGRAYRLRTAPVDPYDAFRGRYVALQFEESSAPLQAKHPIARGQRVYVILENDADGFARFKEATTVLPQGSDYLQVLTKWTDPEKHTVTFALPFDRFYMQETIAPQAEQVYREHSRGGQQDAYALVRVRDGLGVVENLYIGDTPIADVARRLPSRP